MRFSTLVLVGSVSLAATVGCSGSGGAGIGGQAPAPTPNTSKTGPGKKKQALTGKLGKSGAKAPTHVLAKATAKKGEKPLIVRVPVAADGSFRMQLPTGHRFLVEVLSKNEVVGGLSLPTAKTEGAKKPSYLLPISPGGIDDETLDLGAVTLSGFSFTVEHNPLEHLDWDHDGIADIDDNDDDGDGILDEIDDDEDNDGVADDDELLDTDHDGIPDDLDDDDDDDGIADAEDSDDDGDGVADANSTDHDHDGIPDNVDDDDDNDGIPDSEDTDDDGDGRTDGPVVIDTDRDGIPDDQDLDDDNDGIPDTRDTDDDGDGIPDTQETGTR